MWTKTIAKHPLMWVYIGILIAFAIGNTWGGWINNLWVNIALAAISIGFFIFWIAKVTKQDNN